MDISAGIVKLLQQHEDIEENLQKQRRDLRSAGPEKTAKNIQLVLEYRDCAPAMQREPHELYFSVYNARSKQYITEEFTICLPRHPTDTSPSSTIFKNLEVKEISADTFLVCRGIRLTADTEDKKGGRRSSTVLTRRPFGSAVVQLEGLLAGPMSATLTFYSAQTDTAFACLPDLIVNRGAGIEQLPHGETAVVLFVSLFEGVYEDAVMSNRQLGVLPVTSCIRIGELLIPELSRNDLYITIENGKFTQGKNFELTAKVRLDNGNWMQNAISIGSHVIEYEYKSSVWPQNSAPVWKEVIRVRIPPEQMHTSHLHFSVKNCVSGKGDRQNLPFAFAWFKLTGPRQQLLPNQEFTLDCYKPPAVVYPPFYLNPDGPLSKDKQKNQLQVRRGESITIRLHSCSRTPQDEKICAILHWRDDPGNVSDIIEMLTYADNIETIRFLPELLGSLFQIIDNTSSWKPEPLALKCFKAVVTIIGLLVDERNKRFQHYRSVLDHYIYNTFNAMAAHSQIMRSLVYHLENDILVVPSLKALPYLFKFMIKSRLVQNSSLNLEPFQDREFKQELSSFLQQYNGMMSSTSSHAIAAKGIAVKHFDVLLTQLGKYFVKGELCQIFSNFINSIEYEEKNENLNKAKVQLMTRLIEGVLALDDETIPYLMPILMQQIEQLASKASTIISSVLNTVYIMRDSPTVHGQIWTVVGILPSIIATAKNNYDLMAEGKDVDKKEQQLLVTSLLSLFNTMHYLDLFDSHLQGLENVASFMCQLFDLLWSVVQDGVYPQQWFMLDMFKIQTILSVLYYFRDVLTSRVQYLEQNVHMESDGWAMFLRLGIGLLEKQHERHPFAFYQPYITPEIYEQSYVEVWRYVLPIVTEVWGLVQKKEPFISYIMGPCLRLLLKKRPDANKLASDFYYSMVVAEFNECRHFEKSETRTCEVMDRLIRGGLMQPDELRPFFTQGILPRLRREPKPLAEKGTVFINNVMSMIALLSDFMELPQGPEYEEERTIATMKMMEYFKRTDQITYFRYVHSLYTEHMKAEKKNFVEAGITLLLHAALLPWSDAKLEPLQGEGLTMPAETSSERKERLYLQAIECFDMGKLWERAVTLLKDLVEYKRRDPKSLKRLPDLLEREAEFYDNICDQQRFYAEYFRVGYYGRGFPPSIQGKEFIYRGYECERLGDFQDRIQKKFPRAELLKSTVLEYELLRNAEGQHLLITPVQPSSEEVLRGAQAGSKLSKMPLVVKKFYRANNVNVFLYSRPFRKSKEKSENEFADLWLHNSFFLSEDSFPTIHRRSEVKRKVEVEVSPVENAVNMVRQKNQDLEELMIQYSNNAECVESAINNERAELNGTIDSAVNGGVLQYQKAFMNQLHPVDKVVQLQAALHEQVVILEGMLALHRQRCPQDLLPMQEKLEVQFTSLSSLIVNPPRMQ